MYKEKTFPDTAIAPLSGFVYQVKITLYHCLKLIDEANEHEEFEVQLDSTDDFAIYKNGKLVSAHQVKAKAERNRNGYKEALEKCAKIEYDRVAGTLRYIHVSVPLNDTRDYVDSNGEVVKFYAYGDDYHCGLGQIEKLTKIVIKNICVRKNIGISEILIHNKYCILCGFINSTVNNLHEKAQNGDEKLIKLAYEHRISSNELLDITINADPYKDIDNYAANLKLRFLTHVEDEFKKFFPNILDAKYKTMRRLYEHIQNMQLNDLKKLCQLIKPSEKFSLVQDQDIWNYLQLIQKLTAELVLTHFPYYIKKEKQDVFVQNNFYLPTALDIKENEYFEKSVLKQVNENDNLLKLLYEYNNLIAFFSQKSFTTDTKYTATANKYGIDNQIDSNIIQPFSLKILTSTDAESLLNDYSTYRQSANCTSI